MGNCPSCEEVSMNTTSLLCHVHTLDVPKPTVSAAPVVGPRPGLRQALHAGEFEEQYQTMGEVYTGASRSSRPKVYEVQSTATGMWYHCTRVPKAEAQIADMALISRHLSILSSLDHPHVCKMVECFETKTDFIMVCERAFTPPILEFMMNRDGHGWAGKGERENAEIIRQILSALSHYHAHGIVHGRLEPSVVYIAAPDGGGRPKGHGAEGVPRGPPQVKIVDMGYGYVLREPLGKREAMLDHKRKSVELAMKDWEERKNKAIAAGLRKTPEPPEETEGPPDSAWEGCFGKDMLAFVPPETIPRPDEPLQEDTEITQAFKYRGKEEENDWGPEPGDKSEACPSDAQYTDIWATGLIAYELVTGVRPFLKECEDIASLFDMIRVKGPVFGKGFEKVSGKAVDLIQSMLRLSPRLRPMARELLRSPWLKFERDQMPSLKVKALWKNALLNLKETQFRKLVSRVIVEQLPRDHAHIEDATNTFVSLDRDRDGLLNIYEFREGLERFPGLAKRIEDCLTLFEAADRDGSGFLDLHEFAAATLPPEEGRDPKNLYRAFKAFDRDEDGIITVQEVLETATLMEGSLVALVQIEELLENLRQDCKSLVMYEGTEEAEEAYPKTRCQKLCHVMRKGAMPRYVDYEEFVYICETSNPKVKIKPLMVAKKEIYRIINNLFEADFYDRLGEKQKEADEKEKGKDYRERPLVWPPEKEICARTAKCVQQHRGGLTQGMNAGSGGSKKKKKDKKGKKGGGEEEEKKEEEDDAGGDGEEED